MFNAQVDPGQSFFRPAGGDGWQDMSDHKACFRIKGFANASKYDLTDAEVALSETTFAYDGRPHMPEIRTVAGAQLVEGVDYDVAWPEGAPTSAGTYTVTVTGKGDYTGTATATFTIEHARATIAVDDATKVEGEADPTFTGTVKGLVAEGDLGAVTYRRMGTDEAPGTYEGAITAVYTESPNYEVSVTKGDLTITPRPARRATLTFDLAGGTLGGRTGTVTIVASVGDMIKLPAPTRAGHTFRYWRGSEYAAGASYKVVGDHAFTAVWQKDEPAPAPAARHVVTFDANGHGTAPAAQQVEDGKAASRPADPKAEGWAFGGWYTDRPCTRAYDFSRPVTADLTLYAKWTQAPSGAPTPTPTTRTTGSSTGATASPSQGTARATSSGTSSGSSATATPNTGDDSNVAVVALASACASCLAFFAGFRHRADA